MTRLVRFSPAIEPATMQNEFDRLFDTFFPSLNRRQGEASWSPRIDFVEQEDAYLVSMDVPGVAKEDLEIDYHDGSLTISGERTQETRSEEDLVFRAERSFGRFSRTFALPQQVNEKKIEASFDNGVLSVRVPKSDNSKPRRIKIS